MIFSWIRRGLRTGVLTTRYPAAIERLPEDFCGRPALDASRCQADQGCDACVQVCLPGALTLQEDRDATTQEPDRQLILDYGRCIQCGLCVTACPAGALHMSADYELATKDREDLRLVTVFALSMNTDGKEESNGRVIE
jgi:hydrogenase-4 component H